MIPPTKEGNLTLKMTKNVIAVYSRKYLIWTRKKNLRTDLIGCLRKERPHQRTLSTSSVLLHIGNSFCVSSQSTSVNIRYSRRDWTLPLGQKKKSDTMQCTKCTSSAILEVSERFGDICGHPGILRRCGSFGHTRHHLMFHASEQL